MSEWSTLRGKYFETDETRRGNKSIQRGITLNLKKIIIINGYFHKNKSIEDKLTILT